MSCHGGLQATGPRPFRRRRSVCLSFNGRLTSPTLNTWFASGGPQFARSWASTEGLCVRGARGSPIHVKPAEISRRSPCCTRPSCYGSQHIRDLLGRTCERLRACSKLGLGENANDGARVLHKRHTRLSLRSSSASALSISVRVSSNP